MVTRRGKPAGQWPSEAARRRALPGRWGSVCLYTPSVSPSGMGAHMLDLAAEYLSFVEVRVMAWPTEPGQQLLEQAAALGATAVPLLHPRDPEFGAAIEAELTDRPVDVFHIHVGTGRENFDGARAARRAGVPAVVQTQHLPWLLGSRKHRVPFFRAIEPVDHLITVSQAQRRTYERIGVPAERISTVANGIRPRTGGSGRAAARAALGLTDAQLVVLTVGRLTVMKGQRHLIAAVPDLLRDFPDLAVVVVGGGHLHGQLRAQADALGVGGAVRLSGHRADARVLLDAADVFVLPSRHEGMPLVLLEAMEAGLPVVATRVIGSEEVVADGESGLLVPTEDPVALAGALSRLLADPGLRERYGRGGQARYAQSFTSVRMAAQTEAVYRQVLRTQRAGVSR